ncbi:MAG TPA: metallophosphoesterase, partial [Planctomycetota bacterium]|nr:metallophosphoesterase [Planctomycetota bacterium]
RLCRPRNIGNLPSNVLALPGGGGSGAYRFGVIGDPEDGMKVFERSLVSMRERGCAFALICGDLVKQPNAAAYDYFLAEFAEEAFPGPVFTVIGNHDGRRGDDALFRSHFGSPNFAFEFRGDLFVLIDNARGMTDESKRFLEQTLREKRPGARRAFVFAHCPFFRVAHHGTRMEPTPTAWFVEAERLFVRHGVDAVFAGHLHGYRREVREGVLHVVTGGAGGFLDEPEAFNHYVQVDVDEKGIRDSVVPLEATSVGEYRAQLLERILVRYIFFTFWTRPGMYLLLLLLVPLYLLSRGAGGPRGQSPATSALRGLRHALAPRS